MQLGALELVQNLNDKVEVIPGKRVVERLFGQVMSEVPATCPAMETPDLIRIVALTSVAQEVGKEPVIAKPLPVIVQWNEKEILPFQELQHLLPIRRPGDGVAERPAEAIQDAGLEQETTDLFRQMNDDVFT